MVVMVMVIITKRRASYGADERSKADQPCVFLPRYYTLTHFFVTPCGYETDKPRARIDLPCGRSSSRR